MKLGLLLKSYMKERGLSLRDIAVQIGCDHSTVRRLCQGHAVRMEVLYKFHTWLMKPENK